jgi:hypothetical protein
MNLHEEKNNRKKNRNNKEKEWAEEPTTTMMFTRTFLTAIGTRSLQILGTLRRQVLLKQETPASQESFDTLRSANDQLDEVRWSKNGEIFQWLKDH